MQFRNSSMKKLLFLLFIGSIPIFAASFSNTGIENNSLPLHCSNIKSFFSQGITSGHLRNFFMSTINKESLQDYFANATGGAISYHTMTFKGFKFGVKGIFTFLTASNDLHFRDPISGKHAKFEIQLFDIYRPQEKYDLDRLEELYFKYSNNGFRIVYGRQTIKNPLLHPRDGRMKPFVFSGLRTQKQWKKSQLEVTWINSVSPRSTTHFYTIEKALSLENRGYNSDGTITNLQNTVSTKGLGYFAFEYKGLKHHFKVFNFLLENINNTIWLESLSKFKGYKLGLQYVFQSALEKQNNSGQYFSEPDKYIHIISTRIERNHLDFTGSLNATTAVGNGIFNFPRSLARESLFTSMALFWLEGKGRVSVANLNLKWQPHFIHNKALNAEIKIGQLYGLNSDEPSYNRYLEKNSRQYNLCLEYDFQNTLEGLKLKCIYIKNHLTNSEIVELDRDFNRNNFHHFQFITNIEF